MGIIVTKIQRSSFYDGPGIRTTIFLKGCFLRCPWCCNPENILKKRQYFFMNNKCLDPQKKDCMKCAGKKFKTDFSPGEEVGAAVEVVDFCPTGAWGIYGEEMASDAIYEAIIKDKEFYLASGGGITFSGGDPLLWAKELVGLLQKLRREKINIAIETSLFCPPENLDAVIDLVDIFIVDIKILDKKLCSEIIGGNLTTYLTNIKKLIDLKKEIIFRIPAIPDFTCSKANIDLICDFIKENGIKRVEILNVHNLASDKYQSLGMKPPYFKQVGQDEIRDIVVRFKKAGAESAIMSI